MNFRLTPLPNETEFSFAARRLRVTVAGLAIVTAIAYCYWLINPGILVLEHGALAFLASALLSLALLVVGIVLVVVTPLSLLIYLWHLLEQRFPRIQRPRKAVENVIETALVLFGLVFSSAVLYGAASTGVIDSFWWVGFKHRRIAADEDLLFFSIYMVLWFTIWCALVIGAAFKGRRLYAR